MVHIPPDKPGILPAFIVCCLTVSATTPFVANPVKMTNVASNKSAIPSYTTLLFICCGVAFGGYLGSHMRLPVVPLYARSLGADAVQVGIINSAFFLMAALLSFPLGMMSDRLGRKRLACVGALILSATSFLLYFSKTPWQMVWIYLFFCFWLGCLWPNHDVIGR